MTRDDRAWRERLSPPLPDDGWWSWGGPLLVALVAGVLRFMRLGSPHAFVFDETYYAKDGYALLRFGVEQNFVTSDADKDLANTRILAGQLDHIFAGQPEYVVHPPLGKWVIGLGELLFGMDPFGWRVMTALAGTLAVLMTARIGRRLFRSTLIGCIAGALLAVDGLAFVMSRSALLDGLLMFWALAAFGALVVDRDWSRRRLADSLSRGQATGSGPGLGWRPWRWAAGVFLGAACATKWSGLWFVVAFGLMAVLWDVGARRTVGVRRPWLATLVRDCGPAFVSLVVVAFAVYLASWTGWFLADAKHAYFRDWGVQHPGPSWVPSSLVGLAHYHHEAFEFHTNLTTFHAYRANPWGWMVLARPTSFYFQRVDCGQADQCVQNITSLGTPAIWWAACFALPVLVYLWAARRDWRAGAILCGIAAGYLPWFHYQKRTVFESFSIAFLPYLTLALAMCIGLMIGDSTASARRRQWGTAAAGTYLLLAVANFAWLYPALSADTVSYAGWLHRMWWRSWI